ncbi:MAG: stage III sporulation protein AF [Firmicutes bacterium]|nr:stage III sporulation protein AF [Bacillota bacterium]
MFAAVSDWVRHLVFLILLAVMVELVLPQSGLQKYVRAVFGLLIVLTMLDPLRALLTANYSAQAFDQNLQGPLMQTVGSSQSEASTAYAQDLANSLTSDISASFGVRLQGVQVITSVAGDGASTVTGVYASLPGAQGDRGPLLAREIQAQISELLGLPTGAIHVQ